MTRKLEILSKLRKSKNKKYFKSQKSAKPEKKLSKSGNLPKFDTKKPELSFLTSNAMTFFKCLWLTIISWTRDLISHYPIIFH